MNPEAIDWLLQSDCPALVYRVKTELLDQAADIAPTADWAAGALPADWHRRKGLWYVYFVTALAEYGLSSAAIDRAHIEPAMAALEDAYDASCADFMLLRALVKLGYENTAAVRSRLESFSEHRRPDGGHLCLRRLHRAKHPVKSCYKANLHALLLAGECAKKGVALEIQPLLDYFFGRNLFYRSDSPGALVLDGTPGWRTIDTFHPFEPMRVGLHNVVEAFCALGYGSDRRLHAARAMLDAQRDSTGKHLLAGTLTKSYLPREKVGQPSQWVTFYALLAQKQTAGCPAAPL